MKIPCLGLLDLALVVATVLAVWTRTPIGALGQQGVAYALGDHTTPTPGLRSFFRTETVSTGWSGEPIALPEPSEHIGDGLPEPYRSAVRHALPRRLPPHTRALVGEGEGEPAERLLAWLDQTWDGDPEAALERAAIGDDLRTRAIERAAATGVEHPERFANHRRFLAARAEKDAAQLVEGVLSLATVLDLHWPVDPSVRISSPFGHRDHPTLKRRKFHNGVDLPVVVGTPIHAVQSGTVVKATENDVSGKYVILEHAGGVRSAYCHLSELPSERAGDRVEKGASIGKSGNTGRSTGPHLHFVLRLKGKPIDPAPYRRRR